MNGSCIISLCRQHVFSYISNKTILISFIGFTYCYALSLVTYVPGYLLSTACCIAPTLMTPGIL